MLKLQDFRSQAKGLPDLLTYAALIEPGIILQKDGSFLAAWEIRGEDMDSATPDELAYVSQQFSNAVARLGTGWMLHVDACRTRQRAYPDAARSHFPDPVSQAIEDERRAFFGEGLCYNTATFLTATFLPNYTVTKMAGAAQVGVENMPVLEKSLKIFKDTLLEFEDGCAAVLRMTRLQEYELYDSSDRAFLHSDLLAHLEFCIAGVLQPVRVPAVPMYLDAILGSRDLVGGLIPRLEDGLEKKHMAVISIDGLPQESWPAMLAGLDSMPFELRYSTRFICLDQYDAEKEVTTYVKGWNQRVVGLLDQFMSTPNPKINRDALRMREDAEEAKLAVQSGLGAGYLSSTVILLDEDVNALQDNARELRRMIQTQGFGCRIESINALEAWLGSLPGNSYANVRRPLLTTLNLADLLPLQSVWTGSPVNPCPFYPPDSPPLAVFLTDGSTPFWFNIHEGDLAHTAIFGPTGSGKSTLLATIAAQFLRYEHGRIFAFDKGNSLFPLCDATGGDHYEIATEDSLCFTPLQRIYESGTEMAWAENWIESLLELQGMAVLPAHREAIHNAMAGLATQPEHMRTLSHYMDAVQDISIRQTLAYYTQRGTMGMLLDARTDNLGTSPFVVFEMEELMKKGDRNLIPVLTYLFHRIEKALDGKPALLILDEAWVMLGHPVFRDKIREWFKVLRKANCGVILATQNLSDAKNSGIMDVILTSCPTVIYLPNRQARNDDEYAFYRSCGLNDRQIGILANATPKRDYYMVNPSGRRLFQLGLGPVALSFTGVSDRESIARIKFLKQQYGKDWPWIWLKERNVTAA
ncbi:VirB4 family type IV secretion/conjugal transfer ATPase [Desulfovibrio falkowii]|uniref:Conjugal transfer protein TrbE n=1 Tax=Desulfovibrio falkowii TaxID=3136602 RepID=A0ABQ0ECR7_9BACT